MKPLSRFIKVICPRLCRKSRHWAGSWAFYKLRDDGILPVICPTCQMSSRDRACQRPPGYFAWGRFRYFGCESRFGLAAGLPSSRPRPPSPKSASAWQPSLAWQIGERGGARTHDPVIKSHVLYRLSYALTSGLRWFPSAVDPSGIICAETPPAFVAREHRLLP